jgi:YVTN family beta-propeller protein
MKAPLRCQKSLVFAFLMLLLTQSGFSQRVYYLTGFSNSPDPEYNSSNYLAAYDVAQGTYVAILEVYPIPIPYHDPYLRGQKGWENCLFLNPDRSKAYVVSPGMNKLYVIDLEAFQVEKQIAIEFEKHPSIGGFDQLQFHPAQAGFYQLQFHPTQPKLYLNDLANIYVINTTNHTIESTLSITNGNIRSIALNTSGDTLVAYSIADEQTARNANMQQQTFHVFNTSTNELVSEQSFADHQVGVTQGSYIRNVYFSLNTLNTGKAYSEARRWKGEGEWIHEYYTFDFADWNNIVLTKKEFTTHGRKERAEGVWESTHLHFIPEIGQITQYSKVLTAEGSFIEKVEVIDFRTGTSLNTYAFDPPVPVPFTSFVDISFRSYKMNFIGKVGGKNTIQTIDLSTGSVDTVFQFAPHQRVENWPLLYLSPDQRIGLVRGSGGLFWINIPEGTLTSFDFALQFGNSFFDWHLAQPRILVDYGNYPSFAYLPNKTDNTVSVINLNSADGPSKVEVTIPVGQSPGAVAVSPNNQRVYVANSQDKTVSVIQTYSNTVIQTFAVDGQPLAIAASPDHTKIVVTTKERQGSTETRTIRIFDANTYEETGKHPVGFDPDAIAIATNGTIYVAHPDADNKTQISVIDPDNQIQLISTNVPGRPKGMALLEDGTNSKLFVMANQESGSGSVILLPLSDLTNPTSLALGNEPGGIVLSPDRSQVYVAEKTTSKVRIIDVKTHTFLPEEITICSDPAGLSVSKDGSKLYVVCGQEDKVQEIDLASSSAANILLGEDPSGFGSFIAGPVYPEYITALHPTAYITNSDDNTVSVINTETYEVVATIPVGDHPEGIAISPDSHRAYVTNNESETVSVINTTSNRVIKTIPVGTEPMGICMAPDGSKIYVANLGVPGGSAPPYTPTFGSISVIDANTLTVVQTIPDVYNPYGICSDPSGAYIYVSNYYSSTVSVYNAATGAPHPGYPTIPVGEEPCGIAIRPDGEYLYVANHKSNSVCKVDLSGSIPVVTESRYGAAESPIDLTLHPDGTKLFISNTESNTIDVINIIENSWVSKIDVIKGQSRGISFSPHSSKILVVQSASNEVKVYDEETYSLLKSIKVGDNPESFGDFITHEEVRAYIPISGTNIHPEASVAVAVLDTEREQLETFIHYPAAANSFQVQLSRDGEHVLLYSNENDLIELASTLTNRMESVFHTGGGNILHAEYGRNGEKVYVLDASNEDILVIDIATGTSSNIDLPVGTQLKRFKISPEGSILCGYDESKKELLIVSLNSPPAYIQKKLSDPNLTGYFAFDGEDELYAATTIPAIRRVDINEVVDASFDSSPAGTINVLGEIVGLEHSKENSQLYYLNATNNSLDKVDLNHMQKVSEVARRVGLNASCMQIFPDGKTAYILDQGTTKLYVVDLIPPNAVREVELKGAAAGCGCFVRYPR